MKTALTRKEVIKEANDELRNQPWFEKGMEIQDAQMEGHFLTLNASGITDTEGVILMENVQRFQLFAKSFAERYKIQEE
jgi:hypothetical protein